MIWGIPEEVCPSALAFTITSVRGSSLDSAAEGGTFCIQDPLSLESQPFTVDGEFSCPTGSYPRAVIASLTASGRVLDVEEVKCITPDGLLEDSNNGGN